MRITFLILTTALLGACGSLISNKNEASLAVVGTITHEMCDKPSVQIVGIVDMDSGQAVKVENLYGPNYLSPGSHEIFVVCPYPIDEEAGQCVSWRFEDEKPTFKIRLEAGERYALMCFVSDGEVFYQIADYGF